MATRASTRSTRGRSSKLGALDQSRSTSRRKRPVVAASAGVFPLLDDETSRVVLSHLPATHLGGSALVSKAWETLSSKDDLWHPFLSKTDPMSALGEERLRVMSLQYSCKQVVLELSTRLCSCCREPTNGFFVLTCSRVCLSCFETDPSVKMSSVSYARSHYLLSKSQEAQLPTLRVEKAEETGLIGTNDSAITVTTISAAKASAVNRWGSEEAFENEMSTRRAKAEASYEARKQAFNDQSRGAADGLSDSPPQFSQGSSKHQAPPKPRRHPSCPRILGLGNETNYVGINQQGHHAVCGEKYGFFTVVNDAYFDRGPTVVITDDDPESYETDDMYDMWDEYGSAGGYVAWSEESSPEAHHGRKLAEALKTAKHGTTIEITACCCSPTSGLIIDTSVRLGGKYIRTWNAPLVIRAPSIVRDLEVLHDFPLMTQDDSPGSPAVDGCDPSVEILNDALVEECRVVSREDTQGCNVRLQVGRLVANGNTFMGGLCGVTVAPVIGRTTTVHLEGNIFSDGGCGLQKGPPYCHLAQDTAATLAANTFHGISSEDRIHENRNG